MKKYWWIIVIAVILLTIAVLRVVKQTDAQGTKRMNTPIVRLETPHRETIVYTLNYTGDVSAVQQAGIFSKVSGNLEKLYVDIGQAVKAGQLLALIDTTELAQTARQMTATYRNTKSTYERLSGLFKDNLASKQDFDNAQAAFEIATANYETAKLKLDYARITAPFNGIITKRFFDEGALINANNAILFNLMDLSTVKVVVNVLEKDISSVKPGLPANITVDAYPGQVFTGTVSRSSEAVDPATRTMTMEIRIPNSERKLKPGMYATVTLNTGTNEKGLTVPTQALQHTDNGYLLYTVTNGISKQRRVKIGKEMDTKSEVLDGVSETDSIVTVGVQSCSNDGKVIVQR